MSDLIYHYVPHFLGGRSPSVLNVRKATLVVALDAQRFLGTRVFGFYPGRILTRIGTSEVGASHGDRIFLGRTTPRCPIPRGPGHLGPLEIKKVGFESLRLRDDSPLECGKLVINRYLVALYHALAIIRLLALLRVVREVLIVDGVFLDVEDPRGLREAIDKVYHEWSVVLFLLEHLEDEF